MYDDNLNNLDIEEIARKELNEHSERKADSIREIYQWIIKQPNLSINTDEDFIVKFLRYCKYDVIKTKSRIQKYCDMRRKLPEWWTNPCHWTEERNELVNYFADAGKHPENGSSILIAQLGIEDPKLIPTDLIMVNVALAELYMGRNDFQICGATIIVDVSGIGMDHIKYYSFTFVKDLINCFSGSMPIRIKGIHVVNIPYIFYPILQIARIFLSSKMKQRLHFHANMDSLHTHVPANLLPDQYGGTAGEYCEFSDKIRAKIETHKSNFDLDITS